MKTSQKILLVCGVIIFSAQAHAVLYLARPYEPNMARWLTRDPIGEQGWANVYAFTANNPVNRIDPVGYDWTFESKPLGQRPPQPNGEGGFWGGMTTITKWDVKTRLEPCSCPDSYMVKADGSAVVEYWWADTASAIHEMGHVLRWGFIWNDTEFAARRYTDRCVSKEKAQCYQGLIQRWRNYYVAKGALENQTYDYREYGGGGNILEAILDEMIWYSQIDEAKCEAIK